MNKIQLGTDKIVLISIIAVTIIIIVVIGFHSSYQAKTNQISAKPLMGDEIKNQGQEHITPNDSHPDYNTNPPTSGWHYADQLAGAGIHDNEVTNEKVIHSLEHGGVVVNYKADISKEDLDKIKEAFNRANGKKILFPKKDLDKPIALSSWRRLLKLDNIDQDKIVEFIETNNNRSPEKAPI